VEINYGGFFHGFGSSKTYVDGKLARFDGCESGKSLTKTLIMPTTMKHFLLQNTCSRLMVCMVNMK
jgi:hypothetical protein